MVWISDNNTSRAKQSNGIESSRGECLIFPALGYEWDYVSRTWYSMFYVIYIITCTNMWSDVSIQLSYVQFLWYDPYRT